MERNWCKFVIWKIAKRKLSKEEVLTLIKDKNKNVTVYFRAGKEFSATLAFRENKKFVFDN